MVILPGMQFSFTDATFPLQLVFAKEEIKIYMFGRKTNLRLKLFWHLSYTLKELIIYYKSLHILQSKNFYFVQKHESSEL